MNKLDYCQSKKAYKLTGEGMISTKQRLRHLRVRIKQSQNKFLKDYGTCYYSFVIFFGLRLDT